MQLLGVVFLAAGASALVPPAPARAQTALAAQKLNGWVADPKAFCYGLPGAIAPLGNFDPLLLTKGKSESEVKKYRESEVTHGRVAMLAVVGLLVTEAPLKFHPLFDTAGRDIGPAIRHLDEVRAVAPAFFFGLVGAIAITELKRASFGWESFNDSPMQPEPPNAGDPPRDASPLKADYYPGDLGFDWKPKTAAEFAELQSKELSNGRLAMIGIAGMALQEVLNGKEIFVNLGLAPDVFDPTKLPVMF